ncbi:hypothetical protein [Acetivibrio ethanolgignens]|uniref:Uncharacterized protein n=1 Tax=Acetivibrio ethanolgignens TaxID=290052 RepID=A0A0V8QF46_9FIRM|nr:hypothetical protein [Acetivibrio ethanolgignens]KSV59245.1 hypothetical protein ASU35_10010 [Acetivibrio ethanolgignens]
MYKQQDSFFDKWESFEFPKSSDDLWSFLAEHYPDDWYILDYIPVQMKDNKKYSQIEVCYSSEEYGADYSNYNRIEESFLRVLTLLWGFYDSRCETEVNPDILNSGIECISSKDISHDGTEIKLVSIESLSAYKRLTQLSLREKTTHIIFFAEAELIIWVGGLYAEVFTRKKDTINLLTRIATTEGLYLWKKEP